MSANYYLRKYVKRQSAKQDAPRAINNPIDISDKRSTTPPSRGFDARGVRKCPESSNKDLENELSENFENKFSNLGNGYESIVKVKNKFETIANVKLSSKEAEFVGLYMIYHDVNKVAKAMKGVKYPQSMFERPNVKYAIAELSNRQLTRLTLSSDKIVKRLLAIADLDPLELFHPDGTLRNLKEIKEVARKAIQSIEVNRDGRVNIKLLDKITALQLLGKHLGIFQDKIKLEVSYQRLIEASLIEAEVVSATASAPHAELLPGDDPHTTSLTNSLSIPSVELHAGASEESKEAPA